MSRKRQKPANTANNGALHGSSTTTATGTTDNETHAHEMRPRLSAPVTAAITEFSEKYQIPVTAAINLAIVEYLQRHHHGQ